MAICGAEHPRLTVPAGPENGVRFTRFFTGGCCQDFRFRPNVLDDVQLVPGRNVIRREPLHDWVIFCDHFYRVFRLVIVPAARHAQELAPVVNLCGSVRVHGAMDYDRVNASLVCFGDLTDVLGIGRIGEALVVNDHVIALGPVRVVVETDHRRRARSTLVHNGPIDDDVSFLRSRDELIRLERVIVATSRGHDHDAERSVVVRLAFLRE